MKTAEDAGEQARRDVIARLAALSPLEYDRVRVAEAGRLRVRVATTWLIGARHETSSLLQANGRDGRNRRRGRNRWTVAVGNRVTPVPPRRSVRAR